VVLHEHRGVLRAAAAQRAREGAVRVRGRAGPRRGPRPRPPAARCIRAAPHACAAPRARLTAWS
jgi:hypothetical protein